MRGKGQSGSSLTVVAPSVAFNWPEFQVDTRPPVQDPLLNPSSYTKLAASQYKPSSVNFLKTREQVDCLPLEMLLAECAPSQSRLLAGVARLGRYM